MRKFWPALCIFVGITASHLTAQANVRIEPPANPQTQRVLEQQTASAAIRDYLQSWRGLSMALEQNRADLLDADFVGTARDKLGKTVQEQAQASLGTRYHDSSHDIQIVFYSPEGLSIELTDVVEYDMQVLNHGKLLASQHIRTRYVVVLTPTETRWKVRVFQAQT
jgi:hypothetical protein